jgi:hypothetical protein
VSRDKQRRDGIFFEKTGVPKNVPLLDGHPSSSAELRKERGFQDTASTRTPKQWHLKMKPEEKFFTASPDKA